VARVVWLFSFAPLVQLFSINIFTDVDSPKVLTCKCSKHKVPFINDLELDYFLHRVAPVTQLIVVCVINSLYPKASPYEKMMDHIYIQRNK